MKKCLILLVIVLLLTGCVNNANEEINTDGFSNINNVFELENARLAGQKGTIHAELAEQIKYKSFDEYPTVPDELIALKSGSIDAFICEEPQAIKIAETNDDVKYIKLVNNQNGFVTTVEQSGLAIGVAKDSELTNQINDILRKSNFDASKQSALMEEMVKVSLGKADKITTLEFTDSTSTDDVLKVGMECDSDPYNWTDLDGSSINNYPIANNGYRCNGYDVQVSAYIASMLGKRLEVYALEWDSLIPAVESGAIDAIIAGMSPTAERKEQIDFTDVYYETNFVVVVNK